VNESTSGIFLLKISLARPAFWSEDTSMKLGSAKGRVAVAVAGFLSLYLQLSAQSIDQSDLFSPLNNSSLRLPSLALSDAQLFSFSTAFNRMETTASDFLPTSVLPTTTPQRTLAYVRPLTDAKDSSKEASDVSRRNLLDYVHGEVGFLYGRSTGKFGGEYKEGYVIGEVGDEKFRITAGAAFEDSSFRFPRQVR
jgi:hypothetical protein